MSVSSPFKHSFLIQFFEEFHTLLVEKKNAVLAEIKRSQVNQDGSRLEFSAEHVLGIQQSLKDLLEDQKNRASKKGGEFALTFFNEALYIMAALGDEVFLTIDWAGRRIWENALLEIHFFNTHAAGTNLFKNIDKLMEERSTVATDIAALYLLVLGLGFRGQYQSVTDSKEIQTYKKKLYDFISFYDLKGEADEKLFPQAYQHLKKERVLRNLHKPNTWYWAYGSFLCLYFAVTWALWGLSAQEVLAPIQSIILHQGGDAS